MDAALATFLDLLATADEPCFVWGPAELRTACQWGDTLQQLVENAGAAVQSRLQVLRPRLPVELQAVLPVVAQHPLQLLLERLLARPAAAAASTSLPDGHHESWTEAVLAAYTAAVVLRRPPGPQQEVAERPLVAALGAFGQAAAVHGLLHAAAQQAADAAAIGLRHRSGSSGSSASGGKTEALPLQPAEQRQLLEEALQQLTSPEGLESAAAAQLLAQRADQLHQQSMAAAEAAGAGAQPRVQPALGSLLHEPPSCLELELLCLVALLPFWEATLRRLVGLESPVVQPAAASSSSGSGGSSSAAGGMAAQEAVHLLCAACGTQQEALLSLHPALPAEVCRHSFRFTCCYATLLAQHQQAAANGTRAVGEAARWRVAHAAKHNDHATSCVMAKGCTV